jgi:hypothetical protein
MMAQMETEMNGERTSGERMKLKAKTRNASNSSKRANRLKCVSNRLQQNRAAFLHFVEHLFTQRRDLSRMNGSRWAGLAMACKFLELNSSID